MLRAPSTHDGSRREAYRSTGQALVEFALIAPVFFLVFFSIVEFALITASVGSFDFAGRDGARVGSVLGKTDPNVDQKILDVIGAHTRGVVMAKPTEVDIFRANPAGDPTKLCLTTGTSPTAVPLGDPSCMEDIYLYPLPSPLVCSNGNPCPWPPDARDDQLLTADYIGVRVVYQYTYVTGFVAGLGSTLTLSTYSMQRIEPQDFNGLRSGDPPVARRAPRNAGTAEAQASRSAQPARPLALGARPTMLQPATQPLWKRPDERGGIA